MRMRWPATLACDVLLHCSAKQISGALKGSKPARYMGVQTQQGPAAEGRGLRCEAGDSKMTLQLDMPLHGF